MHVSHLYQILRDIHKSVCFIPLLNYYTDYITMTSYKQGMVERFVLTVSGEDKL